MGGEWADVALEETGFQRSRPASPGALRSPARPHGRPLQAPHACLAAPCQVLLCHCPLTGASLRPVAHQQLYTPLILSFV